MPPAAMKIDDDPELDGVVLSNNEVEEDQMVDENGSVVADETREVGVTATPSSSSRKRAAAARFSNNVEDDEDNDNEDEEKVTRHNSAKKKQRRIPEEQPQDEIPEDIIHKENNGCRPSATSRTTTASLSQQSNSSANNRTMASPIHTALTGHRNVNKAGKPPEAGIILKIYVENFMCHRKFSVDLCRNVNFISGQNGSGKSAILAAIQICLGAGARRTNRARNLKELVRKDTASSFAKIRVTLLNKGSDAFEHDKYGDSITVERTIALRGGYNGYKLYDENNEEQSRSKRDLDEMLDKLNIQVENPVAILDQEEAKKFLTGKASDKYHFFMKATELERIDNTYRSTMDQVEEMGKQADRLSDSIEADRELVRETKKAVKEHQEIDKLEGKKANYEKMLAWSMYKDTAMELEERQKQMEMFREKAQKKRDELTQAEEATQEGNEEDDERRTALEELAKEAEESSELKKNLEKEVKLQMEPFNALGRQMRLLKKEEVKANKDLLNANKALQAKRDEVAARAGSAESEQAKRNERLRKAEEIIAAGKIKHNELKQAVKDAFNEYENLEPQVYDAKESLRSKENQKKAIQNSIQSIRSSSGNSLDAFGERCATVKRLVDKAVSQRKFRGPVLGPVGHFCKVQAGKEEFAALAETAIGHGVLDRFIVCYDSDRKLFQNIRRQAGCRTDCGVFQQSQHARYNIPDPPNMDGLETIASVVAIQNDLVFNCLVDNCRIDEKALTRSREESERQLLVRDHNGRDSIRGNKIKEVYFLPKGDNWKITRGGNIQMISNAKRMRQSIGVDREGAIREKEAELKAVEEEIVICNREYSKLEHIHLEQKKLWNVNKKELARNEATMDNAQAEIDKITVEESAVADVDEDTSAEEEEVKEHQAYLDELREKQVLIKQEIEEKEPAVKELEAKKDEITERNNKVLADLKEAENALAQFYQELSQKKEKLEKKREKLQKYEQVIEAHSKKIFEAQEQAADHLLIARRVQYNIEMLEQRRKEREESGDQPTATQFSEYSQEPTEEELEKVEIPDLIELESVEYYQSRVERAEQRIQQERERRLLTNRDDLATALSKYYRAKEIYEAKKAQIKEIEAESAKMKEDMHLRKSRWRQFREFISNQSGIKFDETLNIKGSSGTVQFDHANKSLDLIVQNDSSNENSQQKDVKALSGGERSFTTIALLLALGETLETPFRVMDEFDVFLDPVTRKLIIDILIQVGQSLGHRQFIFITPQDVSNVESSPTIKILKMKPPERREIAGGHTQQTLSFSQAA